MKKVIFSLAIVSMVALFASCGKKTCYCYTVNIDGTTTEETVKVNEEESCVALSGVSSSGIGVRACVEEEARR